MLLSRDPSNFPKLTASSDLEIDYVEYVLVVVVLYDHNTSLSTKTTETSFSPVYISDLSNLCTIITHAHNVYYTYTPKFLCVYITSVDGEEVRCGGGGKRGISYKKERPKDGRAESGSNNNNKFSTPVRR